MDMHRANFDIYYDGPALKDGAMDVKELAPALLAFGELLDHSNRIINKGKVDVAVNIKAFKKGSFGVELEIQQLGGILNGLTGLLSGSEVTAAVNLLALLGFSGSSAVGLFKLLQMAKGKRPKKAKRLESGNIRLEFDDEAIEVPQVVIDLYQDQGVRDAVEKTVSPLENEGITTFSCGPIDQKIDLATSTTLPYFSTPAPEEKPIGSTTEEDRTLSINSLSFKDGNKWLLSDGQNNFWVTITDKAFIQKVENNEPFAKGDLLHIKLQTRQWESSKGLRTEYTALTVMEHRRAPKLLSFDFDE